MTLPYPPPWQDAPTLCAHLCISESTLDNWLRLDVARKPKRIRRPNDLAVRLPHDRAEYNAYFLLSK
jgi:hypothetical protein